MSPLSDPEIPPPRPTPVRNAAARKDFIFGGRRLPPRPTPLNHSYMHHAIRRFNMISPFPEQQWSDSVWERYYRERAALEEKHVDLTNPFLALIRNVPYRILRDAGVDKFSAGVLQDGVLLVWQEGWNDDNTPIWRDQSIEPPVDVPTKMLVRIYPPHTLRRVEIMFSYSRHAQFGIPSQWSALGVRILRGAEEPDTIPEARLRFGLARPNMFRDHGWRCIWYATVLPEKNYEKEKRAAPIRCDQFSEVIEALGVPLNPLGTWNQRALTLKVLLACVTVGIGMDGDGVAISEILPGDFRWQLGVDGGVFFEERMMKLVWPQQERPPARKKIKIEKEGEEGKGVAKRGRGYTPSIFSDTFN